MPAPVTPEGVFGPMPVGGAMIGGDAAPQTPSSFPILATPIAALTPAPMTPDIPQTTMTPAPTTPDIHQATMTSAPTTPVSYPFQMEESSPPLQWNYPIYEGFQPTNGSIRCRSRQAFLHCLNWGKFAYASSTARGVNWSAYYPSYATTGGVESPPPPPSPDATVLERGF